MPNNNMVVCYEILKNLRFPIGLEFNPWQKYYTELKPCYESQSQTFRLKFLLNMWLNKKYSVSSIHNDRIVNLFSNSV
jgi:hypothetical protein